MSANMNITVMYLNPLGNSDYDETFAEMIRDYKYPQTTAYVVSMGGNDVPGKMDNLEYRTYESHIVNETVKVASPHIAPRAAMIAADFARVRVLATESIATPMVEGARTRTRAKDR